jgi:hypothetical protein
MENSPNLPVAQVSKNGDSIDVVLSSITQDPVATALVVKTVQKRLDRRPRFLLKDGSLRARVHLKLTL